MNSKQQDAFLLWVEDREASVAAELEYADSISNLTVDVVHGTTSLSNYLDRWEVEKFNLVGIVMDVQLLGFGNLGPFFEGRSVQIQPNDAGWILTEEVLRDSERPFINIPLLIFTVHSLYTDDENRLERLRNRGGASIDYAEKRSVAFMTENRADKKFSQWIRKVLPVKN